MQLPANHAPESCIIQKATLILLAVALHTFELFIPRIPLLPWLKPGLSNCITLIWIIRFGTADALLYSFLRIWISSFYFGFSLITFTISCSGSLLATAGMGIAWNLLGKQGLSGTIGCSIIGAVLHNTGQLLAVFLLLTRNTIIFYQIPFMGGASLLFGTLIGLMTPLLHTIIGRHPSELPIQPVLSRPEKKASVSVWQWVLVIVLFSGAFFLFYITNIIILTGIAVVTSLAVALVFSQNRKIVLYPLRFWFLFLFVGMIYLFFSYGTRLPFFPLITYEALHLTSAQFIRLWIWLEISLLLQKSGCNELLFNQMQRLFPHRADTLLACLLALEHFAALLDFVRSNKARKELHWSNPALSLETFTLRVQDFFYQRLVDTVENNRPAA